MKNSKNFLLNSAQLDTTTSYDENGDIHVSVCPWNQQVEPLTEGKQQAYPARVIVAETGDVSIKAYRIGSHGPRYRKCFTTEHCEIMHAENGQLVERWKFLPTLSIHEVWRIRRREQPSINAFYLTLKENLS